MKLGTDAGVVTSASEASRDFYLQAVAKAMHSTPRGQPTRRAAADSHFETSNTSSVNNRTRRMGLGLRELRDDEVLLECTGTPRSKPFLYTRSFTAAPSFPPQTPSLPPPAPSLRQQPGLNLGLNDDDDGSEDGGEWQVVVNKRSKPRSATVTVHHPRKARAGDKSPSSSTTATTTSSCRIGSSSSSSSSSRSRSKSNSSSPSTKTTTTTTKTTTATTAGTTAHTKRRSNRLVGMR